MKSYPKRICPFCHKEFIPTHPKQLVCKDDHYFPCPDCGKLVKVVDRSYAEFLKHGPKRCKECAIRYSSNKRKAKSAEEKQQTLDKRKQTNLKKFGVEFASQSRAVQSKVVATNIERYGVERPLQNESINNKRKQTNLKKFRSEEALSSESIQEKIKSTLHNKYGRNIENVSQVEVVKHKIKDTVKSRYGVDNVMKSNEVKSSYVDSMMKTHGVAWPQQSESIRNTTRHNNLNKYGVESVFQDHNVKNKIRETNLQRYGFENPSQNECIKQKTRNTNFQNFGVPYPMMADCVKAKSVATSIKRYGASYHVQDIHTVERMIVDPTKSGNYYQFRENPKQFIEKHFDRKPTVAELKHMLGCTDTPIYDILITHDCKNLIERNISDLENQVIHTIENMYDGTIIHNDRTVISPYELDIYLPDENLAIECNPTITHNSSFQDPWRNNPKSYSYHKMKTDLCENEGVQLFHIFGYEWANKQLIIESMLRNLLKQDTHRIFARKCIIQEVSSSDSAEFLNKNHRQGYSQSSVRLGLYYNDELVSLMTFGKVRNTIGRKANSGENDWELIRFCNLLNTSVVGAASKLFKYFITHYEFSKVVSYSDRAHTRGNLYEILGFQKVSISEPGYVWVHIDTDQFYTRVSCQKQNLQRLFNDDNIDVKNLTEKQIMESHKFAQVFDSGVIRWEYSK